MPTRPFEPIGATQNVAMDGTAKTITLPAAGTDSSVVLAIDGAETVFVRLDGTTPTTANAMPLFNDGNTQAFSRPLDSTTVKAIGASGSTLYVTPGRWA